MLEMVEVVIDSIRVSLTANNRIVILRELDAERYLPIWIGAYEAEAITMALQNIEIARPLTHDLLRSVIAALNARVLRVEVVDLRSETYYGNIVIESDGRELNVDARPSDCIALAIRTRTPILVAKTVLEKAGIIPDRDLITEEGEEQEEATSTVEKADSEGRLSVFENYLQHLDLDKLDKSEDEPED